MTLRGILQEVKDITRYNKSEFFLSTNIEFDDTFSEREEDKTDDNKVSVGWS